MVDFWWDRWLFDEPLAMYLGMEQLTHFLVAEFYEGDAWNEDKLLRWVPNHVVRAIEEVYFHSSVKDEFVWLSSNSGSFTITSIWECIRHRRNVSVVDSLLWSSTLPLKLSFLAWRAIRNYLLVDANLQRRGVCLPSKCYCCCNAEETVLHLFLSGPVIVEVWSHFANKFGVSMDGCGSLSSVFLTWLHSTPLASKNHIRVFFPIVICWCLWLERNDTQFRGVPCESGRVIRQVDQFMELLGTLRMLKAQHFKGDRDYVLFQFATMLAKKVQHVAIAWGKPPLGHVKLNSDASVCQERASGGSLERGVQPSQVEVDSRVLVSLLLSREVAKWPLCTVLKKIRRLLMYFSTSVVHIFREANSVADRLAVLYLRSDRIFETILDLPPAVTGAMVLDARSVPFVRTIVDNI
ncbi:uncharacterized protein LOC113759614 [Coffea eugenioides]|uniref:uncharacterized protein LOC113759614 n=1 Tax=Coffea eugenioides TaxID=49369 RepID=UPI000F615E8D|nr:uncharacterized protein LOC113759614 [Coffea eugenioides]